MFSSLESQQAYNMPGLRGSAFSMMQEKPMLARISSLVRRRSFVLPCLAVVLAACLVHLAHARVPDAAVPLTLKAATVAVQQPQRPMAPELDGGTDWLNTDKPIK